MVETIAVVRPPANAVSSPSVDAFGVILGETGTDPRGELCPNWWLYSRWIDCFPRDDSPARPVNQNDSNRHTVAN